MAKTSKSEDTKLVALAEQLGWLLGTARKKADAIVDNKALRKELTRLRDGATDLLNRMSEKRAKRQKARAKKAKKAIPKASRPMVDAPGKKHRPAPPRTKVDLHGSASAMRKLGKKNMTGLPGRRG